MVSLGLGINGAVPFQSDVDFFAELAKRVEVRAVGRYDVLPVPGAARVVEEIVTGVDAGVHGVEYSRSC